MVGYEAQRDALANLNASVVAASIDTGENAARVASEVTFPVAEGVTREIADSLGSWWEDRRQIIQPSEFILDREGKVLTSTYSSGPVGRIAPEAAVGIIGFYAKQKQ